MPRTTDDQHRRDRLRPAASAVITTLRVLNPEAIEVQFGLKLDAEAGALIAKSGVQAHFTVTMSWDATTDDGQ